MISERCLLEIAIGSHIKWRRSKQVSMFYGRDIGSN